MTRDEMIQALALIGMDMSQVTDAVPTGLFVEVLRLARRQKKKTPVSEKLDKFAEGEPELSRIGRHFAVHAEAFARHGLTREALTSAFTTARRRSPQLTAREFLGVEADEPSQPAFFSEDLETIRIGTHWHQNRAGFEKMRFTLPQLQEGYRCALSRKPGLTAAEFLGQ